MQKQTFKLKFFILFGVFDIMDYRITNLVFVIAFLQYNNFMYCILLGDMANTTEYV